MTTLYKVLVSIRIIKFKRGENVKHEHGGRSSGSLFDGGKLLAGLGISEGDALLDAGCGDGHLAVLASAMVGRSGTVYAVDVHEESLERLRAEIGRKGITNLKPFKADITEKVPIADGAVGLCLLVNVLHGFVVNGEYESAMRELARVIAREGRLVVVEFKKNGAGAEALGPPVDQRVSSEETIGLVTPFGFAIQESFDPGPHHYAVVFRKR
jgi:ubiquinone/menaquinone biosynthesis C-methylase UbiE